MVEPEHVPELVRRGVPRDVGQRDRRFVASPKRHESLRAPAPRGAERHDVGIGQCHDDVSVDRVEQSGQGIVVSDVDIAALELPEHAIRGTVAGEAHSAETHARADFFEGPVPERDGFLDGARAWIIVAAQDGHGENPLGPRVTHEGREGQNPDDYPARE